MTTLLMAFFLCVLTFSSVAGLRKRGGLERDSVVWRPRLRQAPAEAVESSYREPSRETADHILHALDGAASAAASDNFAIRLPLSLLFENEEQLSSSGRRLLHALAVTLHDLPWDLQFQVGDMDDLPSAVQLCHFLMSEEDYEPARLAAGSRPQRRGERDFVWLVLFHHS